jgi:hypothetical protein
MPSHQDPSYVTQCNEVVFVSTARCIVDLVLVAVLFGVLWLTGSQPEGGNDQAAIKDQIRTGSVPRVFSGAQRTQ